MKLKQSILYLGYNSFLTHKRGVENVIDFQSRAYNFCSVYYIHWGLCTKAYKNNKFICISIRHCWYWPITLNLVLYRIRKKNSVLLHSHNPLYSVFSLSKTDILTVHDGLYYQNKSKKRKFLFLFYITEIILYSRCKTIHFISDFSKRQSLFGRRKNFIIIPNTSHYEPFVRPTDSALIKSDTKSVLIVRSIEERARFDLLMRLAEKLQNDKFYFTVAGKGPLLDHYQHEIAARKLENIKMLGFIDDATLCNLYSKCDLVLMIAEYGEGFGLPVIEGYLFNKPVIASNCCAIPEVIISADYLFENNIDSIIKSMNHAFTVLHSDFLEYYNVNFSNAVVLAKFKDLYSKAIS